VKRAIEILVIVSRPPSEECAACKRIVREVTETYRPRVGFRVIGVLDPAAEPYRGLMTPAVLVAGRVISEGHAPRREQLEQWVRELLEEQSPRASRDTYVGPMLELEAFILDGVIDEVVGLVKPGKEAAVYLARKRGNPPRLFAAKVYRDVLHRSFRDDSVYRAGRFVPDARMRRAVAKGTRRGRPVRFGLWVGRECEVLRRLREAGADVPRVIGARGSAILMEYIGDEDGPAPMLRDVRLGVEEARRLFDRIVANLEVFLKAGIVHADLSPYNILYWRGDIRIIDFPQAVDLWVTADAADLFARDVQNVCDFFADFGVRCSTTEVLRRFQAVLPRPGAPR